MGCVCEFIGWNNYKFEGKFGDSCSIKKIFKYETVPRG